LKNKQKKFWIRAPANAYECISKYGRPVKAGRQFRAGILQARVDMVAAYYQAFSISFAEQRPPKGQV